MKAYLISLVLLALSLTSLSQIAPNKYYVQFTDKNNSPYSIDNPEEYLSERALERRQKQNIPVDFYDLPVNPAYVDGVAATGAAILNRTKWFNGVTVLTVDPAVVDAIAALPYVAWVTVTKQPEPGFDGLATDNAKPFFHHEIYNQYAPSNLKSGNSTTAYNYGFSLNQIQMLKGDLFHESGYRGEGMVIAVLDAGYTNADDHIAFDSLWLNDQILGTRDFVAGGEVTFNQHPHGTMVLSCMGGNVPGELIGTAPKASYWLLRSEDGASEFIIEEYNWVSAAEFADSVGADVINSSLGYSEFNDPVQNHVYADMNGDVTPVTRGADFAASRGILVVNSLGNEGNSPWYYLSAPSDGDSVMGIGAVNFQGSHAGFSSHGPSYDGRVKPNVVAQGSGVYIADPYGNAFTYGSGTSFSSPVLAGMAACLWQANPSLNNMQIKEAIEKSASQYTMPDDSLGYGIPDFMMANNILTVIESNTPYVNAIHVYPNPVSDRVTVHIRDASKGEGRIVISDVAARNIVDRNFVVTDGNFEYTLPVDPSMAPGIYFLKISLDQQVTTVKLLKK